MNKIKRNFPGSWNGIDQMVFNLAISSTLPDQELTVTIQNDKYTTKTVHGKNIIQVDLFKNKKNIATWQYDYELGEELFTRFEEAR
jgi:hypothetical protein